MSSRKRRQPEAPASPVTPSKRTRFQEKLPQTPSKTISGQPTCKSGAAGVYAIQGIVDESDDKYLIEWENSTKATWVCSGISCFYSFLIVKNLVQTDEESCHLIFHVIVESSY